MISTYAHQLCLSKTPLRGMFCSYARTQPKEARGFSASGVIPAVQMWCFIRADSLKWHGDNAWRLATLGCYLQPMPLCCCLARPAAQVLSAKWHSGHAEDFVLRCSQRPTAPATVSTSAWKSLDGRVSPAMQTSPTSWLPLPPPALAENCSPFPAGDCKVVKGEASPRQGAGRCLGGLFLSRVKYLSA